MVGRTPLLSLNKLAKQCKSKARILGKCEFYNPLFSVKDRVALKMIEAAEAGGEINENTVLWKRPVATRVSVWRQCVRPRVINW